MIDQTTTAGVLLAWGAAVGMWLWVSLVLMGLVGMVYILWTGRRP